jgi:hypothetical protein
VDRAAEAGCVFGGGDAEHPQQQGLVGAPSVARRRQGDAPGLAFGIAQAAADRFGFHQV